MKNTIKSIIGFFIITLFSYTNAETPITTGLENNKTYETKELFEKVEGLTCESATDGCNTFFMKDGKVFGGTKMFCNTPEVWSCKKVKEEEIMQICTMEYAPVCGVNGKTYSNKCVAGNNEIEYTLECKDRFMSSENQALYKAVKNRVSIKSQEKINGSIETITNKISKLDTKSQKDFYSKLVKKIKKLKTNRNTKSGQLKYYVIQYIIFELEIINNEIK